MRMRTNNINGQDLTCNEVFNMGSFGMKEPTKLQIVKEDDESIEEFMGMVAAMLNGPKHQAKIDSLWDKCFRPTVRYGKELEYDSCDFMSSKESINKVVSTKDGEDITLKHIESEVLQSVYKVIKAHFEGE